jgi:hypothetical protein
MMERRLFTVTDTFLIQDRGLVLVPGIAPVDDESFRVGDALLLKRPDGVEITTTIGGLELLCPNPKNEVVVMLHEFGKEDVPLGTEVWSQPKHLGH